MFCVGDPLARVMTKKGLGGTRTWGRSQLVPEKEEEEEGAAVNKEEEEKEEEGGTASSSMEDGQPGRQGGGLVDTLPSPLLPSLPSASPPRAFIAHSDQTSHGKLLESEDLSQAAKPSDSTSDGFHSRVSECLTARCRWAVVPSLLAFCSNCWICQSC